MKFLIPLVVFGVLAVLLGVGLSLNPRQIPSALIGRPVPDFNLPPVEERPLGLASRDRRGEVSLVNVFASWCVACQAEYPVLIDLARQKIVAIHGLNYNDKPDDAARWLDQWGVILTRASGRIWTGQ